MPRFPSVGSPVPDDAVFLADLTTSEVRAALEAAFTRNPHLQSHVSCMIHAVEQKRWTPVLYGRLIYAVSWDRKTTVAWD